MPTPSCQGPWSAGRSPAQSYPPTFPTPSAPKITVTLNAEIVNTADVAFGRRPTTSAVLTQTFNDADLAGRPLTIGHFVSVSQPPSLVFSLSTYTYTPFVEVGDEAFPDPAGDRVIQGQAYQEVFTNFPLGSQLVTGLFLDISLSGPQGPATTLEKTLLDREGYAAQSDGTTASAVISYSPAFLMPTAGRSTRSRAFNYPPPLIPCTMSLRRTQTSFLRCRR